jgi:hypothetical protein
VADVLRAHWGAIAGADFFTTEVWTWQGLVTYYTVFVIDLASRRVQIVGSTPSPDARFMQQVVRVMTAADEGSSSSIASCYVIATRNGARLYAPGSTTRGSASC